MELRDKERWLSEHGYIVRFDNDPDTERFYGVLWQTHGSMRFKGVGYETDEMWGNLFDVVKETLFLTCR